MSCPRLALAAVVVFACRGPQVASIVVEVDPDLVCADSCVQLPVGQSVHLVAVLRNEAGQPVAGLTPHWSSANDAVAIVDQGGRVTGVAAGPVSISASVGIVSGSIVLTILPARVASIELTPKEAAGAVGQETLYTATARDALGQPLGDVIFHWSSSNPLVATIDSGRAHPMAGGYTIISATTTRGGFGWASLAVPFDFVPHGFVVVAITAGAYHACALAPTGSAYCWGWNFFGELGRGIVTDQRSALPVAAKVLGDHSFRTIATGLYHTCAIDLDYRAWCWGINDAGELGWAPSPDAGGSTVPIVVGTNVAFTSIAAGNAHSCALDEGGHAWCWGANNVGQVGAGDSVRQVTVPTRVGSDLVFNSIVAAGDVTCALTYPDGIAYCWGQDEFGQIGDGRAGPGLFAGSPTRVVESPRFRHVAISARHACGLSVAGDVWCWGDNSHGQLGVAPGQPRPSAQPILSSLVFEDIAAGAFSSCGLSTQSAWCWGHNGSGELGDGTLEPSAIPVAVKGGLSFQRITGGSVFCGLSLASEAFCWGTSWTGQLGAGFYGATFSAVPLAVLSPTP